MKLWSDRPVSRNTERCGLGEVVNPFRSEGMNLYGCCAQYEAQQAANDSDRELSHALVLKLFGVCAQCGSPQLRVRLHRCRLRFDNTGR